MFSVEDRLANLLGVVTLEAAGRLRAAVETDLTHGGSAPAALVHLRFWPGDSLEGVRGALGISQPATVRLVDRLVAEGLLERRPGVDRRTRALHLTTAGEAAAAGALERRAATLRALVDRLEPGEREALELLLERLVAMLADDLPQALHVCRLCDRGACRQDRGCPLDHTTRGRR